MRRFILLGACLLASLAWGQFTCRPVKSGCVCKTPATLTCGDLNQMQSSIVGRMNSVSGNARERFKGGVVRLAFHDAAEFKFGAARFTDGSPAYRSDGCVDLSFGGNAGLAPTIASLDALWTPFCSRISRADFWFFAAKVVIEQSTPYVLPGNPQRHITNWMLPFFIGRVDRVSCPTIGGSVLPDAEGGGNEIQRTLINNLGLDVQHTVALLGAHCLGGASASGYTGRWTINPDRFTTQFYESLILWGFIRTGRPGGLQQYNIDQRTSATPATTTNIFMLNTDMALFYDIDHSRDRNKPQAEQARLNECGPPPPQRPFLAACPFSKDVTSRNFEQFVRSFADKSGGSNDSPGAGRFLFAFARAFTFMGSVGYADSELTCMRCTPNICTDGSCSTAGVQCGTNNRFVSRQPRPTAPPGGPAPQPPAGSPTTTTTRAPTTRAPNAPTTRAPPATTRAPPATTRAPGSTGKCTVCSAQQRTTFCSRCQANAFVCTAGGAMNGCGGLGTWDNTPSCTACCSCSGSAPSPPATPRPPGPPAPATPRPPTPPSGGRQCTTCSASQRTSFCNRCAAGASVCTAGSASGGCGGATTWTSTSACSACCVCTSNANAETDAPAVNQTNAVVSAASETVEASPVMTDVATSSTSGATDAPSQPAEVVTISPPTSVITTSNVVFSAWGMWTAAVIGAGTLVVLRMAVV